MYPDYGQYLWDTGARGKVRIVGAVVSSISTAPNKRTNLTFDIATDDGFFQGKLNTHQKKGVLLNFLRYGKLLVIEASLSSRTAATVDGQEYDGLTGALVEVSGAGWGSDRVHKTFEAKSMGFVDPCVP